jgi:branched-chain amino acid aminotransferase
MNDYSQGCAFVDGKYVPVAEAKISLLDWGFLHSDATYDVVHVWDGKYFRLDDHLERFFASMKALRLSPSIDVDEIKSVLNGCLARCGFQAAYVEMGCTRGLPEPGSRDPRTCKNQFFAFAIPFVWIADLDKQAEGLNLVVSQRQRIPSSSVDPRIKNYHWLDLVMALFDAYDAGGETAVVVDAEGNLVEGPGFNIFCVKSDTISTPANGVLQGITRKTAIEIAESIGFNVQLCDVPAPMARAADEIFVTSTGGGIIPVTRIDGSTVGSGKPGPVAKQLQAQYWALHEDPAYALAVDYNSGV